ncbi:MAG: HAMP domain-containing sensor histidine kinase, partial [Leptolyngbyaceae bacterium]|nr:HAMP domain-containing sensor histidine kinase [Leptolyngbyaceae bacterium]
LNAERDWFGAIAALNHLLHSQTAQPTLCAHSSDAIQGLVFSGPSSILSHPELTSSVATWVFSAHPYAAYLPLQLPPTLDHRATVTATTPTLPLLPEDPLATEPFCIALTAHFSLVMVLGENAQEEPAFAFSFDPAVVEQAWQVLQPRILLTSSHHLSQIEQQFEQFAPVVPDYKVVMQFSRLLLQYLAEFPEAKGEPKESAGEPKNQQVQSHQSMAEPEDMPSSPSENWATGSDVELLQAIGHEVRTPLTTIRLLTRLLLNRKDLAPDVLKRLEMIDRECSEQIDRFSLIFRAVELETSALQRSMMPLTATPLDQLLQHSIPRWQKQAHQRNLNLEVVLPQKMPTVVSDPTMLDQALTGLIDRFTRNLPTGSHIQVEVMLAGNQLKLQFQSRPLTNQPETPQIHKPLLKSLGQLLIFQPETGNLSLSMSVTKHLFRALGGKLTVRQRPQQGEIMTVFLPLEVSSSDIYSV